MRLAENLSYRSAKTAQDTVLLKRDNQAGVSSRGQHRVFIERVDVHRWDVSVDGRRLASFCTESRARNAGRTEARRLDFVALERRR